MPEFIEREALIKAIRIMPRTIRPELVRYSTVQAIIDKQPAADVAEVIRCKDCAHYGGITFGNICRRWSGLNVKNCTKPDDYCSYGIRKDW